MRDIPSLPKADSVTRLEGYLPESAPLRLVRGLARVLEAPTWTEASEVVAEENGLAGLAASPLIEEFAAWARRSGPPEAANLIELTRDWLRRKRPGAGSQGQARPHRLRSKPGLGFPVLAGLLHRAVRVRQLELHFLHHPTADRLRMAQRCWRTVLQHRLFPTSPLAWRLDVLNAAGNCLLLGTARYHDSASLETALDCYRRALEQAGPENSERHRYRYNLGRAWYTRYEEGLGRVADLHRAIEVLTEALREAPADTPLRPTYVETLAGALGREYQRSGSIEHLERAIAVLEEVLSIKFGEPLRGALMSSLGSDYRKRHQRSDDPADLERAIALGQAAVDAAREDDRAGRASRYTNLGSALLDRHARTGATADLGRAIACFRLSVQLTEPDAPEMASRLNNLGNGLSRRGGTDEQEEAVTCYRQACERSRPGDPQLASRFYNLGNALRHRASQDRASRAVVECRAAYRQAVTIGLVNSLEWALAAARNWGDWAVDRGAWREAVTAYRGGLTALQRLFEGQFRRSSKEAWLREAPALATHAAYALARVGRPGTALTVLERGRARLLAETLERVRMDLDRLSRMGHANVLVRFERAAERLTELNRDPARTPSGTGSVLPGIDELRQARSEYLGALRAIRRVPRFRRFLIPMPEKEIRQYGREAPLVYLLSAAPGGAALIVRHDRPTTPVWLPALSEAEVRSRAESLLRSYWARRADRAAWLAAVDACGQWLGSAALEPLEEVLREAGRAVVVPGGLLGLLPMQAAWVSHPTRADGRRYFIDNLRLTQVPNARALSVAQAALPAARSWSVLAVGDPEPVNADPLPFARQEATLAARHTTGSTLLLGPRATIEAIDSALSAHGVLHFACHASARTESPLDSALFLSEDAALTLKALFAKDLDGVRLALLSACETAVPGLALPDEVVSLPTGLLHARVPGVVASLWAVGDESTMFLMGEVYRRLRTEHAQPAEALRQAQCWLRDATAGALAAEAAAIRAEPDTERGISYEVASGLWRRLVALPPVTRPFAHPVYWAGFGYYGI